VIKIIYDEEQAPEEGLAALFERAAGLAAEREGIGSLDCEVSLFFADTCEMRQMNLEYRGIDAPTDVLSFPMQDNGDGSVVGTAIRQKGDVPCVCNKTQGTSPFCLIAAPTMLGDIVICREIAEGQAAEYGHSEEREIAFLFTHGLLHLLGYDHQTVEEPSHDNTKEPSPCVITNTKEPSPCVMRAAEKEIMEGMGL